MTIQEASKKYKLPVSVLREYKSWGLCDEVKKVMDAWEYDDCDLERLGMIMTLHNAGFDNRKIQAYMRLYIKGESTRKKQMDMLNKQRQVTLDEIHLKEKQIDSLDYLRFKIRESNTKGGLSK